MVYALIKVRPYLFEIDKYGQKVAICLRLANRNWHIMESSGQGGYSCLPPPFDSEYFSPDIAFNAFRAFKEDGLSLTYNQKGNMTIKDSRLLIVADLIKNGAITQFKQIFDVIPDYVLAKEMGIRPAAFDKKKKNVGLFILEEIFDLADKLELDELLVVGLISNQYDIENGIVK